jgi:hypothetical protein
MISIQSLREQIAFAFLEMKSMMLREVLVNYGGGPAQDTGPRFLPSTSGTT